MRPRAAHCGSASRPISNASIERRIYSNHGPLVLEFEQRLAKLFGLGHRLVVHPAASGTAALAGAILAAAGRARRTAPLGVDAGLHLRRHGRGGRDCAAMNVYLADIDPDTWMLDPAALPTIPLRRRNSVWLSR